jgi:hypothetical protein
MYKLWLLLRETPRAFWPIYLVTYLAFGAVLQFTAPYTQIARFAHDWQVVTLYGLYLVPLSALLRGRKWHMQYAYAIMTIAPVDIIGFMFHTSIAYPNNFIDAIVGERNFTMTFVLIAAWIPYVGNVVVEVIAQALGSHEKTDFPMPNRRKPFIRVKRGNWNGVQKVPSPQKQQVE